MFIFKRSKELPFVTPTSIFKKTENRFLIEGERTFSMESMTSRIFRMHMTKTVQIFNFFFFCFDLTHQHEIFLSSMSGGEKSMVMWVAWDG